MCYTLTMNWQKKDKKNKTKLDGLPDVISRILVERGIDTKTKLNKFLNPKSEDLYDPFLIPDMKKAVNRILSAKEKGEKVAVYGDYDADGVTATSILWDFLYRQLGLDVIPYIPSRFTEGYGLNKEAIQELEAQGISLIISVDCGVKDKEIVKEFSNLDFIITDHHTLPDDQNFDYPVVHPKRDISKYPFQDICGAVVAWKVVDAIAKSQKDMKLDSLKYIDLASIGTVCDVMPLIDENRTIVSLGLKQLSDTPNTGLKILLQKLDLYGKEISTYDIGFIIGPRINAAGRLDSALNAVRLFATQNERRAEEYTSNLDNLNIERQELTIDMLSQAEEILIPDIEKKKLLFVFGEGWNEGVIGLVAGRLCEKYNRPVICATIQEDIAVASARSIGSFNITEALGRNSKLLKRYGGHVQAAGFSLDPEHITELKSALEKIADEEISEQDMDKVIKIDEEIKLEEINNELVEWLEKLEPYGFGNPTPVFQITKLKILSKRSLGKENQHVKLNLTDEKLRYLEAISFNVPLEEQDKWEVGSYIDVVGNLGFNRWNGNISIQMKLKDVKIP